MKFRLREGFGPIFRSLDEKVDYEGGNKTIRPRAVAGDVFTPSGDELGQLRGKGRLGILEPVDEEARAAFGDTTPLQSLESRSKANFGQPPPKITEIPYSAHNEQLMREVRHSLRNHRVFEEE